LRLSLTGGWEFVIRRKAIGEAYKAPFRYERKGHEKKVP
jgi:hypothetical protein